jgi:hypothetical protein
VRNVVRKAAILAVAASLAVLVALPVMARGAQVTTGEFQRFAAGLADPDYADIGGGAVMIRTASGATIVIVTASGLIPGAVYGSHVHKQSCEDGGGGGHYSFGVAVPGGAFVDGSEIWPGPFQANAAGRAVGKTVVGATAGPTAVSVVIHAPISGAKIACADLS